MPQHPQYTNSPDKNIQKLYDLLEQLQEFGMIHEELHQSIDVVMSDLYSDALKAYVKSESRFDNEEDADDDENEYAEEDEESYFDDVTIPGAYALFDHVDDADKEQFVQDLRNVIAHYLSSGSFETDGVADEIQGYRDIDYYRMHVRVTEDFETIDKYEFEPKSVWFPSEIVPVKSGIYEISRNGYQNAKHSGYAYWDGKKWYDSCVLLDDCRKQAKTKDNVKQWGNYCWRGFINEQ